MLRQLTIRQRILVTFLAIVLTGSILQLLVAGWQIQLATLEFYQHHLETNALLVASGLSEPLEYALEGKDDGSLQRILTVQQSQLGHDFLLVDRNYRLIASTNTVGYPVQNTVPRTPEIMQAESGQIGADVRLNPQNVLTLFVAAPVLYESHPLGFLVLSAPMQPVYDDVARRWLGLAGAALPVLGLVIVASLWISGTISRPVTNLRNSALKMAGGALDTRIEVHSSDEIGQLAQTLNYMAGQIDGLIKAQRSFVSYAAHELRTPLTTLKLRADILADERVPQQEKAVSIREIRQEVDHMAELVSSLLTLTRIDEGRHKRSGTVTDTVAAFHDIARHWRIEAVKSGLQFETSIAPNLPEIPLSTNDLRLILDNLLGNAVKYTPEGSIQFQVEANPDHVLIRVRDTGIGFTPEQAKHLFERFYRSETSHTRFPGNGLGLSIVQAILMQYKGCVQGHSEGINKGATFEVTLPLKKTARERQGQQ
ncbi:MAG: HAMP domain-containing histidine kinase [Anaerolineaceae bacterium]|nr:HAMP domain-containing histidine kinase [Anaerolineaceae bacterium]